ncbi:hypothetical protein ACA910_010610 [Epithemia clementina (nom. ined.)]
MSRHHVNFVGAPLSTSSRQQQQQHQKTMVRNPEFTSAGSPPVIEPIMDLALAMNASLGTFRREGSDAASAAVAVASHRHHPSFGLSDQALAVMMSRREEAMKSITAAVRTKSSMLSQQPQLPHTVSTTNATHRGLSSQVEMQVLFLLQQEHMRHHHAMPAFTKSASVAPSQAANLLASSWPQQQYVQRKVLALPHFNYQPNSVAGSSNVESPCEPKNNESSFSSVEHHSAFVTMAASSHDDRSPVAPVGGVDPLSLVKLSFPEKIHYMLKTVSDDNSVVSYVDNGAAFLIHKPRVFESEIMPLYFSSNRLSSFQRQLNIYGFQRIDKGPWHGAYRHSWFVKDQPELLKKIKRYSSSSKKRKD